MTYEPILDRRYEKRHTCLVQPTQSESKRRAKARCARVDVCANAFSRASLLSDGTCVSARRSALEVSNEKKWKGELSLSFKVSRIVSPKDDEE